MCDSVRFCCALLSAKHYAQGNNYKRNRCHTYKTQVVHHMFPQNIVQAVCGIEACFALNILALVWKTNHRVGAMNRCCSANQAAACRNRGLGYSPDHVGLWVPPILYLFPPYYATSHSVSCRPYTHRLHYARNQI